MKQTFLFLAILVFGLTAISCSSTPKRWYKPGGTTSMYERDKTYCEDVLIDRPHTGGPVETYTWESCMENQGWVVLDSPAL